MELNISLTQALHTLNISDHILAIIHPTLPHLSPYIAETAAIGTLSDSPARPKAATNEATITW